MRRKVWLKSFYNGWLIEHLGLYLSCLHFTSQNNENENEEEKGLPREGLSRLQPTISMEKEMGQDLG
jgi:hypothetical protein